MKSTALALALATCLLASCGGSIKDSQDTNFEGENLTDLPTAIYSRALKSVESNFIEIVIHQDQSELFHQGKRITTTSSEEELFSEIRKIRDANDKTATSTPLLLSAPASTPFKTIRQGVRTAAKTGIYQILFLVRSEQSSRMEVVSIELPTAKQPPLNIEPYPLQIDSEGRIFSGTGSRQNRVDEGIHDQFLNKLSQELNLYGAAAQSAGNPEPPCQFHVAPDASYQRVIDLLSLVNKHQIHPFFTDNAPEKPAPVYRKIPKPTPPDLHQAKPLGLAPKK